MNLYPQIDDSENEEEQGQNSQATENLLIYMKMVDLCLNLKAKIKTPSNYNFLKN